MKTIALFGSTGSIGRQTLEVCRNFNIKVNVLTANKSTDLIYDQILEFSPEIAVITDPSAALELKKKLGRCKTVVLSGESSLCDVFEVDFNLTFNALVGSVGVLPTIKSIEKGIDVALANKETLVCCGELIMPMLKKHNVKLIPVDSEHSAIFQCIDGINNIEKILITCSGGPFRGYSSEQLKNATKSMALKHPKWNMGEKITIDCATLMNKGLEVIEARWLFNIPPEKIEVLVHPQSIIHSMVQYEDGAVVAQLGTPDMRVPIQYALCYPERPKNSFERFDFFEKNLSFEKPDVEGFPCLSVAYDALKLGESFPAVMNAANEAAVAMFLDEKIHFTDIYKIIERTLNAYTKICKSPKSVHDFLDADKWAREFALCIN